MNADVVSRLGDSARAPLPAHRGSTLQRFVGTLGTPGGAVFVLVVPRQLSLDATH